VEVRGCALENMVSVTSFWRDRVVLITGHTGFKGSWLALWLQKLGAHVHGYAIDPPTQPSLFEAARVRAAMKSDARADLADLARLRATFESVQPQVVFHLAAQPLVRESYRDPLGTFATNIIGTAHVLEAARTAAAVQAVVLITTDKVYDNRDWPYAYRETDALGGHDPYSASKAAAEIVAASYRASFFADPAPNGVRVATARAGNVIGGGDWAMDRLIPDCIRAFERNDVVRLRYPGAVRPWQHVLEPLAGYLLLAQRMLEPQGAHFATAWNFGPDASGDASVGELARMAAQIWGGGASVEAAASAENPHEAGLLRLDSACARTRLGWQPRWSLYQAVDHTIAWHRAAQRGEDMADVCRRQIDSYESAQPA